MTCNPKSDLKRITQLIAELQAIDTALVNLKPYHQPSAKIVMHYVTSHNVGHDVSVSLCVDETLIILEGKRRGVIGLLKVHGLDVE